MKMSIARIARVVLLLPAFALLLLAGCASPPAPQPSLRTEQQAVLRELGFAEIGDGGWLMTIAEPISFEFNKSDLRDPLRAELEKMAAQLRAVKIDELRCEGHTDNIGSHEYNEALSLARAQAVAAVFASAGFSPDRIIAVGRAFDYPVASNDTEEGRSSNRRVEIIVPALALSAQ